MKIRLEIIRNEGNLMSDIFNWDYNPYKVGDKVIIDAIIWKNILVKKI